MDKKPLVLSIFGWAEILIGGIGTLIYILAIFGSIYYLFFNVIQTEVNEGFAWLSLFSLVLFLPFPFILWAGIGVLKLKSFGKKINFIVIKLILVLVTLLLILQFRVLISCAPPTPKWTIFVFVTTMVTEIIIALSLILPILLFFNQPALKELFK